MKLRNVSDHLERLSRHLGRKTKIGNRNFKIVGYLSNILDLQTRNEPEMTAALKRLLQRPGTFIDVGANLGQTLGKVLEIDPTRNYLGFEPQIGACHYLDRFLKDNNLSSAQVLPLGLSDSEGFHSFWANGEADTMASLAGNNGMQSRSVIMTRRGDAVLAELGISDISVIKIDVEGAELSVMRGLEGTLSSIAPPIIFEVLPNYEGHARVPVPPEIADRNRSVASELMDFLSRIGYSVFQLDQAGTELEIQAFDLDNTENFRGTNYVARKVGM